MNAGTDLSRLNLSDLQKLPKPISPNQILAHVPGPLRASVKARLEGGGLLTPKGFRAFVDAILKVEPRLVARLSRYSADRRKAIAALGQRAQRNLAEQKETVITALKIAAIDPQNALEWTPPSAPKPAGSYLEGLEGVRVREDVMLSADHDIFPGLELTGRIPRLATKIFENNGKKIFVTMANRLPLEQQTGADLIYFNATFGAFVFVQYKAMEKKSGGEAIFRIPNEQLDKEIARMDVLLSDIKKIAADTTRDGFRLSENPFFLKLCSRLQFNPDDGGLFPGMYLPLDYWKRLVVDPAIAGPSGGKGITFENVGRRLTNPEFVTLVGAAWVGTTLPQSALLQRLIEEVLAQGKTVTIAVRKDDPPPERSEMVVRDLFSYEEEHEEDEDMLPPLKN
jgi:hypothetical protein